MLSEAFLMVDPAIIHFLAVWQESFAVTSQKTRKKIVEGVLGPADYHWMEKEALRFWDAFGDRPEVTWDDTRWQDMRSVRIHGEVGDWSMLFPWSFYVDSLRGWGADFKDYLENKMAAIPKLQQLSAFAEFYQRQRCSQPFPLKPTMVKVIQALAQMQTMAISPDHGFPTAEDLEQVIEAKKRSIQDALNYLLMHAIVDTLYLINYAKLGFDGYLVMHSPGIPDRLIPYVLRSKELFFERDYSIIFFPRLSQQVKALDLDSFALQSDPLTSYTYTWNLEGLTVKPEDRWQQGTSLFREASEPPDGLKFELISKESPPLTESDVKLLDLLASKPYRLKAIASTLDVAISTVKSRWDFFIDTGVLRLLPRLHRFGLDYSPVLFCELESFDDPEHLIRCLQFYPKSEIFWGKKLLLANLSMPSAWASDFTRELADLRSKGHRIAASYTNIKIGRWNFPLEPMWLPSDFLGQRWK